MYFSKYKYNSTGLQDFKSQKSLLHRKITWQGGYAETPVMRSSASALSDEQERPDIAQNARFPHAVFPQESPAAPESERLK